MRIHLIFFFFFFCIPEKGPWKEDVIEKRKKTRGKKPKQTNQKTCFFKIPGLSTRGWDSTFASLSKPTQERIVPGQPVSPAGLQTATRTKKLIGHKQSRGKKPGESESPVVFSPTPQSPGAVSPGARGRLPPAVFMTLRLLKSSETLARTLNTSLSRKLQSWGLTS